MKGNIRIIEAKITHDGTALAVCFVNDRHESMTAEMTATTWIDCVNASCTMHNVSRLIRDVLREAEEEQPR